MSNWEIKGKNTEQGKRAVCVESAGGDSCRQEHYNRSRS